MKILDLIAIIIVILFLGTACIALGYGLIIAFLKEPIATIVFVLGILAIISLAYLMIRYSE